ncbi:hypothetical protein OAW18_07155 [Alphaproteobacteria bacterium]|nr:hypothetical protein [Alphaproteobacteria bacterium]
MSKSGAMDKTFADIALADIDMLEALRMIAAAASVLLKLIGIMFSLKLVGYKEDDLEKRIIEELNYYLGKITTSGPTCPVEFDETIIGVCFTPKFKASLTINRLVLS